METLKLLFHLISLCTAFTIIVFLANKWIKNEKLGSIIKLMIVSTSNAWVAYFSIVIVIMLALLVA